MLIYNILIFLIIFGSIFNGDNNVSFRVGLLNQSDSEYSQEFVNSLGEIEVFNIDEEITNIEQAREKMNRGQLDATIILPNGFGDVADGAEYPSGEAKVLYDQNNQTGGQTLASILDAIFTDINNELVASETPFTVIAESTATKGLTYEMVNNIERELRASLGMNRPDLPRRFLGS